MNDSINPRGPARYANGRFGPGNPGRTPGSRNRMSKAIALGLLQHYRDHEKEILDQLYRVWFSDYIRLIGRMLPKEPKEGAFDLDTLTPEETSRTVEALRGVLARIDAGEATLADFESVLSGETLPDNGESAAAPAAPKPSRVAPAQRRPARHNGDSTVAPSAAEAPAPPPAPPPDGIAPAQPTAARDNGDSAAARARLLASAAPVAPQPPPSRIDDYPGIRPRDNGPSTVRLRPPPW